MSFPGHDQTQRGLTIRPFLFTLIVLALPCCLSLTVFAQASFPLSDDFNGGSLDTSKWSITVLTGLQDTSISVTQTSGQLQIGPLLQNTANSHYNGISSANSFDFTGAFAYVQLVQSPATNTTAFTMFAVLADSNNYYHFYESAGSLVCEQKIGGTKTILASVTYSPVAHQFLRIRHDAAAGNVVFETAPNNNGVPGPWALQFTAAWNTTAVPLGSVHFEMKAGTSFAESNPPGTVIFDNFKASVLVIQ